MKKSKLKRVLSVVLATVMVVGTIEFTPQGTSEVQAAETATVKDINLGTGGFSAPTSIGSNATSWAGSKVYYGSKFGNKYENKLWRVLDPSHDSNHEKGSAFLFSEELQGKKEYQNGNPFVTWDNCSLRKYLNGPEFLDNTFTTE